VTIPIYLHLKFLLILTHTPSSSSPLQCTWNKPFAMPYQHSRSSSLSGIEKRISELHIRILLLWLVGLGFTNFFSSLVTRGRRSHLLLLLLGAPLRKAKPKELGGSFIGWLQVMNVTRNRNRSLGWRIPQVNSKFIFNKHIILITT
jgi:hypothetical protein